MSRPTTLAALLVGAVAVAAVPAATPADARSPKVSSVQAVVSAAEVVGPAAAGGTVSLTGVTIEGDVDLRPIGTLTGPFRCRECRLTGSLNASDVVFERAFEISNSVVERSVELSGAVFKDRVSFDGTEVAGPARANASRFLSDASFVDATFLAAAEFEAAAFERGADFRLADFAGPAGFRRAQFGRGGTFRLVRLSADASFDESSAGGPLDFGAAVLEGEVSLSNLVSSGSLSLEDILVRGSGALFLENLSVPDLVMAPSDVGTVRGRVSQEKALELIERGAERRGDLGLANDARYERLSRQAEEREALVAGAADRFVYRGITGYLVRPLHPLVAFLVLLGGCSLLRAVIRPSSVASGPVVARVFSGVATSSGLAFSRKPGVTVDEPQRARSYVVAALGWTEFLTYKVLIAVFLLALGSSNSTIRQILDAIRS